jgi:transposase InsO family protein
VDFKLAAVLARQAALREAAGAGLRVPKVTVTALCQELGISRPTYYEAERRFAEQGLDGLLPRSRRPHSSPDRTPIEVEDEIVRIRKEQAEQGWDNGAVTIQYWLSKRGFSAPAVSTINRILVRRGLVEPQPRKRPKSANKRFQFTERNGCWQADAFDWQLADGTRVAVFQILDDCTRMDLDDLAAIAETSAGAVAAFLRAVERYGPPALFLSDNGVAFSGRIRGWVSDLEKVAAALGCRTIQSSPYHPQTNGKNERVHFTCQQWLRAQPRADTLTELQQQLDRYRELYNNVRPHQALGMKTPAEAAAQAAVAAPGPAVKPTPRSVRRLKVKAGGDIATRDWALSVGRKYAGRTVIVLRIGDLLTVLLDNKLLFEHALDHTRHFQSRISQAGPTQQDPAVSTMS